MFKNLVIGDPHIRPQDLHEGLRLSEFVYKTVREQQPDAVTLTGDLYHYHEIVHVEVMHFWREFMRTIPCRKFVLLGNHDAPHDMPPGIHALSSLASIPGVTVIDRPTSHLLGNSTIGFVPFMRSNEEFVAACQSPLWKTVYCHQEFDGCKYDNGFYSKVGVNLDALPHQDLFISGHIHTGQEFGKVWYVGAPRWMTASDANQDRCIWMITHDGDRVVSRVPFRTDPACQRMVRLEDTPESPVDLSTLDPAWKVLVDVRGPAAWVEERKPLWRGKARTRTFITGEKRVQVRESEGLAVAFQKYVDAYEPRHGTPKDRLAKMVQERIMSQNIEATSAPLALSAGRPVVVSA